MAEEIPIALAPAKKRLAVFLDGTWNFVGTNTNVWRLRCLTADTSPDGTRQLIYYDPGLNGVVGGGWGKGLSENVQEAYQWLVQNCEFDDEIFIFGFSRGAFTARSLAGFVAFCGLLKPGGALGVSQLYDRYRSGSDRTIYKLMNADDSDLSQEERWMKRYSRAIPIHMVGVWDTVGALGIPVFQIPGVSTSTLNFLHTGLRQSIKHGFHALAIDEHRKKFLPTIWTIRTKPGDVPKMRPIESVEQRWFVGSHGNVGGGTYNDLLAQIPLRWMMKRASNLGLTFKNSIEIEDDAISCKLSDSHKAFMKGWYHRFVGRSYRLIGAAPGMTADGSTHSNVNETIDASVFEGWRRDPTYRPHNLNMWKDEKGVDPASVRSAVFADDPTMFVAD